MSSALYVFWLYLALATGGASGYPMDLRSTSSGAVACTFAVRDRAGFVGVGCVALSEDVLIGYECRRIGNLLDDCARLIASPSRTIEFMLDLTAVEELR